MSDKPSLAMIMVILPEIALIAIATWMYLGATLRRSASTRWPMFAVLGLVAAGVGLAVQSQMLTVDQLSGHAPPISSGPVALDALAYGARFLAVLCGLLLALAAALGGGQKLSAEFNGTLLMAVAGVMLASAAMDLVLLFVALELISIPTYVLLLLGRNDRNSGEAAAKYFFLSILSSAVLLYGFALLYGAGGSTELPAIKSALLGAEAGTTMLAIVALVMIVAGLAFKIAAVPMHFYAPDVYQGTTNANAGLLAVLPKIAGIVVLTRLVAVNMPGTERFAWQLTAALAVLTMTLGNVAALWQNNLRRLLAYSSIAHSGYMLIGLTAALVFAESGLKPNFGPGLDAMLFYLVVYALATTGAFAALAYLSSREREVDSVDELAGIASTHPLAAAALGVCMFSLAGIPPLAGFWGKLSLFGAALDMAGKTNDGAARTWLIALVVIGALNAAVGAAYYLRIVGVMYFRNAPAGQAQRAGGPGSALAGAVMGALLVVAIGVLPGWLVRGSQGAGSAAVYTSSHYDPYKGPRLKAQGSGLDAQRSVLKQKALCLEP